MRPPRDWLLVWVTIAVCASLSVGPTVATGDGRGPRPSPAASHATLTTRPHPSATATDASLELLAATVSTSGWLESWSEGQPFIVSAPARYILRFGRYESMYGTVYAVTLTNFDPTRVTTGEPLLPSTPGMVSIALQLLPAGHPPGRMGAPAPGEGAETATVRILGRDVPSWRGPGDAADRWPRADGTWVAGAVELDDGRTLLVSALVSTPGDSEGIRTAYGILKSIRLAD